MQTMTQDLIERSLKRSAFADVALVVTAAALVVSLFVAATAVSIGLARADTLGPIADSGSARFALASFLGLVLAGMGGLTAFVIRDETQPRD
jgi:hypothetical protein